MAAPPPLTPPQKALKRVLTISALDSRGLIAIAGLSLVISLLMGELLGVAISALVLWAGIMEMRGRRALKRRDAETGMKLLIRAQLFLLAVILVYCARCLGSFDPDYLKEQVVPTLNQFMMTFMDMTLAEFLQTSGLTVEELIVRAHQAFLILYGAVAVISIFFQGGLALYYRRRVALVTEALAEPPAVAGRSPQL
jgi:hypothetical protein